MRWLKKWAIRYVAGLLKELAHRQCVACFEVSKVGHFDHYTLRVVTSLGDEVFNEYELIDKKLHLLFNAAGRQRKWADWKDI